MNSETLQESFIELVVENFKVAKMLEAMIKEIYKIDYKKAEKFQRQKDRYITKNKALMEENNIKIIDLKEKKFEDGMSVDIVNAEEIGKVEENQQLYILQMLEPIVMKDGEVKKVGKVVLEKRRK